MAERDEPFLRRWSRRKRAGGAAPVIERPAGPAEAARAPAAPAPEEEAAGEGPPSAPAATDAPSAAPASAPDAEPVAPEDLPDIDSLGPESDYTPFLKPGVPEHLARRALRKLWRSDPLLANLDGLNDYDEDFAKPFLETAGQTIKTYWTEMRDAAARARAETEAEAGTEKAKVEKDAAAVADDALAPSPAGEEEAEGGADGKNDRADDQSRGI